MIPQKNVVFFNGSIVKPDDKIEYFGNNNSEIISVEIAGDFSSGLFHFEGVVDLGNEVWTPIAGVNLSDYSITADPEGKGIWEVPIEGVQKFRVRTESVTGGTAKVFGRVIKTGV